MAVFIHLASRLLIAGLFYSQQGSGFSPPRVPGAESRGPGGTADAASYKRRPESTAVLSGQTVNLRCAFSGLSSGDTVVWQGPPNDVVISTGHAVFQSYRQRHRIVGDSSNGEYNLQISRLKLEDSGKYKCSTASVPTAEEAVLTVVVPMAGPPEIIGAELPLTAGHQLVLRCRSRGGHPPPRLVWYNGTREFGSTKAAEDTEDGQQSLELFSPRVSKWDNGANFTCIADQGFPHLVKPTGTSRILRVNYPPIVSVPSPSVHVREGQTVNLTCYVDANPRATVKWRRLGDILPPKSRQIEKTLNLQQVSRQDRGVYQCEAKNRILPDGLGTVTLEVFYPPSITNTLDSKVTVLHTKNDFSLGCLAEGNPKPHVRWRRKGTSLYWDNPLRFHRVRYDVEGTYECVATSDGFPQATSDVFLDVVGKPQIKDGPSLLSIADGDTARFFCDVMADPTPGDVTWIWRKTNGVENVMVTTYNGITISKKQTNEGTSSVLTIDHATTDDEGVYICKASNMFGKDQREVRLMVKGTQTSIAIIISVSMVMVVLAVVSVVVLFIAKRKEWICRRKRHETPSLTPSKPVPPLPKYARKPGHGTNDSGVEDLELQELDGTLKPRPPPRMGKDWTAIGLSYPRLAHSHSNTLPPYSTVERHRPEGEDIREEDSSREGSTDGTTVMVQMEQPPPPPRDKKRRWNRRAGDRAHRNQHEAENVLNETQAESL
ncbi:PREDICTED: hemicentin-1-like [Branchiostoma belcheri]|uniref:Hemicentin-1-like n=1 Tax=Branchiostoma belcheri TaxID=7741 RepID=A0A6P4ZYK0_BRABE|nr:PREDICTED: hemicentin-1-like [Branchiostoma belcheri]